MDKPLRTCDFPQQVSNDQASQDRSAIAFSNGASYVSFRPSVGSRPGSSNVHYRNDGRYLGSVNTPHIIRTVANSSVAAKPPRYPNYIDYSQRLRTFARWSHVSPGPTSLAEAGFFFTNEADLVRCYQCGIGLKDFSPGDKPLEEHVRHSADCLFLLEYLGASGLTVVKTRCSQRPECTSYGQEHREQVLQCLHPEYQTVAARISSFVGWPRHMTQTPTQLAEAGLFYTGVEDQVRCFMCGGGLRRWDADDVPWTEHCRWFPECPYAKEQKGDDFIALVQASAANSNEDRESGNDSVTGLMEGMALRDPEFRAALDEHISTCVEMGYQVQDVNEAIQELRNMGNIKPTIEELIDLVEVIKERRQKASVLKRSQDETPLQENVRLKQMITCMLCGKNKINVLFLPCTHHRLCMDCAETLSKCPVCDRNIRQKIKTYLV